MRADVLQQLTSLLGRQAAQILAEQLDAVGRHGGAVHGSGCQGLLADDLLPVLQLTSARFQDRHHVANM